MPSVTDVLDEVREALADQVVRRATEQLARAMVDALDDVAGRFEDEHGLGHGVEDLPEPICGVEGPRVLDRGAGPCREIDRELQVAWSEPPAALGAREGDGPEDPSRRRSSARTSMTRSPSVLSRARCSSSRAVVAEHGLVDLGRASSAWPDRATA